MRRNNDLENRLSEWGKDYGGGRYENTGWQGVSPLAVMMKYQGRAPQGLNPKGVVRTASDDVESAVRVLEQQIGGRHGALALRCEYLNPGKPIESKLQMMRRIGVAMSRAQYFASLKIGRVHVAGWLRITFDNLYEHEEAA
jgi:hypothetical protein